MFQSMMSTQTMASKSCLESKPEPENLRPAICKRDLERLTSLLLVTTWAYLTTIPTWNLCVATPRQQMLKQHQVQLIETLS